ncbi:MAG: hypothetical protein NW203_12940 [Hyphomonadaceae bacterium]|nr:hypothetical protein [Hyphomonadaceae bacterium]
MSDKRKKRNRARNAGIGIGAAVIAALAVVGGLTAMSVGGGAPTAPHGADAHDAKADAAH